MCVCVSLVASACVPRWHSRCTAFALMHSINVARVVAAGWYARGAFGLFGAGCLRDLWSIGMFFIDVYFTF